MTPSLDYAKVLSRKRVGYGGHVAAFPEALTLLELLPGLPPEGTVGTPVGRKLSLNCLWAGRNNN